MKTVISLITACIIIMLSSTGTAQVALNAPPEDPVYQAVDIFIAHGLVNDVIMGQRPFSRLEIARILRKSRETLEERKRSEHADGWKDFSRNLSKQRYLEKLLDYYEKQYAVELAGMEDGVHLDLLKKTEFAALYNGSAPRAIPVSNGQGSIDGVITSFDRYDQGLTYPKGGTAYIQTETDLYLTRYLAMTAQPRFEFLQPQGGDTQVYAHVHRLYLKTGWRNFEFEIGRDNLLWGQGEYGGMFSSANPRPLDMIKLSNPYPLRIPHVGWMKFTFFVSNLGPERYHKYPYFYGAKWTWKPVKVFEFALTHTIFMSGDGAPLFKWWEPIAELMPFHKWGGSNVGARDIANNAWGFFEFRLTIPPLRHSVLYYEGYVEDSIGRAFGIPDNLLNQLGFVVGWYMPRLTSTGDFGLRLEYHHAPPLMYRHGQWRSGYTLNRRLMGDPLGPTADGVYATLYWRPNPTLLGRIQFAYEDFDSSTYYTETNAKGGGEKIRKLDALPHEHRFRMMLGGNWLGKKRYGIKVDAGYEYIDTWNFQPGVSRNNFFLMGKLILNFDEFVFSSR